MTVSPTQTQLHAFGQNGPEGPVQMLNLLRFREQANYPAGSEHSACTGAQAYARYGENMLTVLKQVGGTVEVLSQCHTPLIGEARDHFDHMVIVRYPTRHALLEMLGSAVYKDVVVHRTAAVEHSLLLPMTNMQTPLGSHKTNKDNP